MRMECGTCNCAVSSISSVGSNSSVMTIKRVIDLKPTNRGYIRIGVKPDDVIIPASETSLNINSNVQRTNNINVNSDPSLSQIYSRVVVSVPNCPQIYFIFYSLHARASSYHRYYKFCVAITSVLHSKTSTLHECKLNFTIKCQCLILERPTY